MSCLLRPFGLLGQQADLLPAGSGGVLVEVLVQTGGHGQPGLAEQFDQPFGRQQLGLIGDRMAAVRPGGVQVFVLPGVDAEQQPAAGGEGTVALAEDRGQ